MKKLALLILLLMPGTDLYAWQQKNDSLTRAQFIHNQTAKADTLNQTALNMAGAGASSKDLNEAISLIMRGLHIYSRFRDSTGLRETFDHLGMIYHRQKKYVQAKWFTIEANTFAREMRDTDNVIRTLINLAAIKTDIKDYDQAKHDLTEALNLAKSRHAVDLQIAVETGVAKFYTQKGDVKKSASAMNRIIFLKDSVNQVKVNKKLDLVKQQYAQKQAIQQALLKQQQIDLQQEKDRLQVLTKQKNSITLITTSIITAIVLLICGFYLRKKRGKRKKTRCRSL